MVSSFEGRRLDSSPKIGFLKGDKEENPFYGGRLSNLEMMTKVILSDAIFDEKRVSPGPDELTNLRVRNWVL